MQNCLVFEHVPKAAGTTLRDILSRHYRSREIFVIKAPASSCIEEYKAMPSTERERFRLIMGHGAYPHLKSYIPGNVTWITFLRDPIDRTISHYYYVKHRPEHPLHKKVKMSEIGLLDYVNSIDGVKNNYTKRFSGLSKDKIETNPSGALEIAKNNLENDFIMIGISERFDESLILMKRLLGWKDMPFYKKLNAKKKKRGNEDKGAAITIDDKARSAIKEINELDIQLYEHFLRILDEAVNKEGPEFEEQLALLQRLNKIYRFYPRPMAFLKDRISGVNRYLRKAFT